MIINVEAQKDFHPGYAVPSRGVFYGARMISAQKGIDLPGAIMMEFEKFTVSGSA